MDIAALVYLAAAALDVLARVGSAELWAIHPFRAATILFLTGVAVSVFAALTGRIHRPQVVALAVLTLPVLVDIGLRLSVAATHTSPTVTIVVLSIVIANLVALSGAFGDLFVSSSRTPRRATSLSSIRLGGARYVLPNSDGSWARWQLDLRQRKN